MERPVQWKRLGALFLPYWKQEAAVLSSIAVTSVLGLVPPLLTMKLIDKAIPGGDTHLLYLCVGGMVGAALVSAIIGFGQGYMNAYVAEGILRDLRTQLYGHMNHMPLSFFTSTKTGEIMNRVSSDVDNVDDVVSGTLVTIVTNILTLLSTVIAIFVLDWRLALLAVAMLPFMIYPLWPVGRKMYEVRKATRKKRDHISSLNQETLSISGMTLVKSFVRELYERTRYHDAATDLMDSEIKLAMIGRWFMAVITGMVIIGPAIVWLGGGWMRSYIK